MKCEICGEKEAEGKVIVDGTELAVCSRCKRFGKEVVRPPKATGRRRREVPGEDIVPDYAKKLRRARQKKGISLEELGKELNEKSTVLHKVERGEMLPDDRLARKLEKFFGIRLHGAVEPGAADQKKGKLPGATLGDLAEIKVKK